MICPFKEETVLINILDPWQYTKTQIISDYSINSGKGTGRLLCVAL